MNVNASIKACMIVESTHLVVSYVFSLHVELMIIVI